MGLLPHGPFACKQVDSPYYPSESHEAARQAGLTCLGDGEPGFYLAGPPGAGKTTILRQILKHEAVAQEILVVNSAFPLSRKELIQSLLFDCQLPLGGTEVEVHLRLMDHLAGVLSTSCSIWVLVDDAGSLGADALGELFALTRITGKGGARLQVLMGGGKLRIPRRQLGRISQDHCATLANRGIGRLDSPAHSCMEGHLNW